MPPVNHLESIASRAYALITENFPVCAASDEFYFFPQVVPVSRNWLTWDDFSVAGVASAVDRLGKFEAEIAGLPRDGLTANEVLDRAMLGRALRTLREQLAMVATHCRQPTFHLTALAAGLGEALTAAQPEAWAARVAGAPAFLRRAEDCLTDVPELFLRLGRAMLSDLLVWMHQLHENGLDVGGLPLALNALAEALQKIRAVEGFRLPEEVYERILAEHLDCGMDVDAAWSLLHDELQAMEDLLGEAAGHLAPGLGWVGAARQLPIVTPASGGLLELYRLELAAMADHCRQHGLIPAGLSTEAALRVAAVPDHIAAIRASDAYSAHPGHPACGGTFFVMEGAPDVPGDSGRTLEYRLTAVHEVWPGHHLLDFCRWSLDDSVRRPLESPLFYEGWACLAEELMARTGYLDGPWDRFLIAKRRAERAARGLVDLGLQTGRMDTARAVALLVRVGFTPQAAKAVIPKYLLRPGYQVCYTLGLHQGLACFEQYGRHNVGAFASHVLGQGEIGFGRLQSNWPESAAGR